jgi:glycosyltransferase involved in cell wall biosynthesis
MTTRILVTTSTFPSFVPGHVTPPFVYELARRLADDSDLEIFVSTPDIREAKPFEVRDGLAIHRFRYGFTALCDGAILPNIKRNRWLVLQVPFFLLFAFVGLVRTVRRMRIDVVHAHWIIPQGLIAVMAKLILRRRGLAIVCTSHGADIYGLKALAPLKRWILAHCDGVTVVSSGMKTELERIGARTRRAIQVIPMGVDSSRFTPDYADPAVRRRYGIEGPFILFVGRLAEKKGVKFLLEAMPRVLAEFPAVRVLIVGSGPEEPALKRQAKDLGLEGVAIFAGAVANDELPAYYASADVFVGPSIVASDGDREGMPVSFMEAMSAGCAVISTDLEGIDDLIRDGVSGFLVRQRSADDIADRLMQVLSAPESLAEMKRKARQVVTERFDWRVITTKYRAMLLGCTL